MKQHEYGYIADRLQEHDNLFEINARRGKGSHRMVFHPDVDGCSGIARFPIMAPKTTIAPVMQKDLIRIFRLPEDIFD